MPYLNWAPQSETDQAATHMQAAAFLAPFDANSSAMQEPISQSVHIRSPRLAQLPFSHRNFLKTRCHFRRQCVLSMKHRSIWPQ
jgi:hypothetical protein